MKTKLKLIEGDGLRMTNMCGRLTERGYPMVGSGFCKCKCEFYCGEVKFLWWRFVKCSCRFS